jgi:hypothetical protein
MKEAKELCEKEQWGHLNKNGEKVVYRDLWDKAITWASTFKDAGAAIAAFDPTNHAGLAWGGFQVLVTVRACCSCSWIKTDILQAATQNKEIRDLVFDLEPVAHLITRYTIVECLYLDHTPSPTDTTTDSLKSALIELYVKVLNYQIAVKKYLDQGKAGGYPRSTFKAFSSLNQHYNIQHLTQSTHFPVYCRHILSKRH